MKTKISLICTPALLDNSHIALALDSHSDIFCGPTTHFFDHPTIWNKHKFELNSVLTLPSHPVPFESGFSWSRPSSAAIQYYLTSYGQLKNGISFFDNFLSFCDWFFLPRLILENKKLVCDISNANIFSAPAALSEELVSKVVIFHQNPQSYIQFTRGKFSLKLAILAWLTHHNIAMALFKKYGHKNILLVNFNTFIKEPTKTLHEIALFLGVQAPDVDSVMSNSHSSLRMTTDNTIQIEELSRLQHLLDESNELSEEEKLNLRVTKLQPEACFNFNKKTANSRQLCRFFKYPIPWSWTDYLQNKRIKPKADLPKDHKNRIYNFYGNLQM